MYKVALDLFQTLAVPAFELAFTFAMGGYIIRKFLEMALGGKFKL